MINIAIGSDHAGFELKEVLISYLKSQNIEVIDKGCFSIARADYADAAHAVATEVVNKKATFGILICGSANGVAITANKHQGIRAGLCWENEVARLVRLHNDANIICIPARFVAEVLAEEMIETFMTTEFEGGRHATRVGKIACG